LKIFITPTSFSPEKPSAALKLLSDYADKLVFNDLGRPLEPKEIVQRLDGMDGYVAGLDYIDAEVIKTAPPSLKVISRYGAGYDRIDITAAREKGIVVTNTPGVNAQAVADLTIGLMISVARKIPVLDRKIREGQWIRSAGLELYGKTIGIIGLGAIGKGVAKRAVGFSMNILAYDPFVDEKYMADNEIQNVSLDMIFASSDFITLHLPLSSKTRHIINESAFSAMKKSAILINTSRGGLIDEALAYEALVSGKLGGLGLDAFEKEPPDVSPLFSLDNVVMTPHTGAHSMEAMEGMGVMAVRNLIDVLSGRDCPYIVK
jgi:D-3-phosphoglycerate dehydrogenase